MERWRRKRRRKEKGERRGELRGEGTLPLKLGQATYQIRLGNENPFAFNVFVYEVFLYF